MFITFRFRIKDSQHQKWLRKKAQAVNLVWNYCNEISPKVWKESRKWISEFQLISLCKGAGKDLNLSQHSILLICNEYVKKRSQCKRSKLNWRSKKRKLGWIPFSNQSVKLNETSFQFMKRKFKFWKSRNIFGTLKLGSFNEDSLGHWYVNFVCELPDPIASPGKQAVGIDLGLTNQLTLSDGTIFQRENLTKKYATELKNAQKYGKKKVQKGQKKYNKQQRKKLRKIHQKIKNKRKDWNHKISAEIIKKYDTIYCGDVKSSKLMKKKKKITQEDYQKLGKEEQKQYQLSKRFSFAKSVADASWYQLKTFFEYKAKKLGKVFQEVNERFTTTTCSVCSVKSGPSGLSHCGIRTWKCSNCKTEHHRDVNAAQNILFIGQHNLRNISKFPLRSERLKEELVIYKCTGETK